MVTREFLNPSVPLLKEVVDWLLAKNVDGSFVRAESVEGAVSLSHLMVVVPTAQSGRNLRLALAQRCHSVLPPCVVLPMQLVKPAEMPYREVGPEEAAIAFLRYTKTHHDEICQLDQIVGLDALDGRENDLTARFTLFDQLADIWRTLAGQGLLMRDVVTLGRATLEADIGDEWTRWEQLVRLEAGFFSYLHERGVYYPTEAVAVAKSQAAIVGAEIREIVLPALADPVRVLGDVLEQQVKAGKRVTVLLHAKPGDADRFDTWGWPKTAAWIGARRPALDRFSDDDVVCAANASALARIVAADVPSSASGAALPSIALCDDALYQGVAVAFLSRGYSIHNPERHLLAQSSLGGLIRNLISLYPATDMPWCAFMGVLRSSDVSFALGLDIGQRASVLRGADVAQNAFIPATIPTNFAFPACPGVQSWQQDDFNAFCETGRQLGGMLETARKNASLGEFLRCMLRMIFAAHPTGERADEKEFLAAVEGARTFLAALESDFVQTINPSDAEFMALARRALDAVAYSLEPDAADAIKTEGWLELPWTAGEQIALVGFHEGKVPDVLVGHPFLPDGLRTALGLVSNEDRLARDTWIFKEILDSHAEHAVRAYLARTSDAGDICRPSRILYLCSDADLPGRVKTLFRDLPAERTDKVRHVEWPLTLPDIVEPPDHFSASALDVYVRCPFTYLLKYGLRMNPYREKRELEANDFGVFIHAVLEGYARRQIERGDDQLTDAREIRRLLLEEIVPACRAHFVSPTLNIELQLKAAEGRLSFFAEEQAAWARQGWRIREAEFRLDDVVPELGVRIRGSIDRIDENICDKAAQHWCLIDYKTWDEKRKFQEKVMTSPRAQQKSKALHFDFANTLGLPLVMNDKGQPQQRVLSVQLPVYGKGYAAKCPRVPFAEMSFRYFVLGKTADETGFSESLTQRQTEAALAVARRAVALIGKGVFWPPGPTDDWKWDYAGLFSTSPVADLADTRWVRSQMEKLEACHV